MYTIYHIPGVKVGCTNNLKRRMQQLKVIDYEVLEIVDSKYKASEREIYWQIKLGYGRDCLLTYEQSLKMSGYIPKQKFKETIKTSKAWRNNQLRNIELLQRLEVKVKRIKAQRESSIIKESNLKNLKLAHTPEARAKFKETIKTSKAKAEQDAKRRIPILQYDSLGNFIKEWEGIGLARKEYGDSISPCLKGRQKRAYGFIWKYKNETTNP